VNTPQAYQLQTDDSPISLANLAHTQLDRAMLEAMGDTRNWRCPSLTLKPRPTIFIPVKAHRGGFDSERSEIPSSGATCVSRWGKSDGRALK